MSVMIPAVERDNRAGERTRSHFVEVATALFAERGVEAVSLTEIRIAAGQKNKSAVAYHFGNKDGLIHAVVEYHTKPTRHLLPMLMAEVRNMGPLNPRAVITLGVTPVADQISHCESGANFILMLSNLFSGETGRSHQDAYLRRWQSWVDVMDRAFPARDAAAAQARMRLFSILVVQGLADWERHRRAGEVVPGLYETSAMIIDSACALFAA